MARNVYCSSCGTGVALDDAYAWPSVACPRCGQPIQLAPAVSPHSGTGGAGYAPPPPAAPAPTPTRELCLAAGALGIFTSLGSLAVGGVALLLALIELDLPVPELTSLLAQFRPVLLIVGGYLVATGVAGVVAGALTCTARPAWAIVNAVVHAGGAVSSIVLMLTALSVGRVGVTFVSGQLLPVGVVVLSVLAYRQARSYQAWRATQR